MTPTSLSGDEFPNPSPTASDESDCSTHVHEGGQSGSRTQPRVSPSKRRTNLRLGAGIGAATKGRFTTKDIWPFIQKKDDRQCCTFCM